MGKAVPLHSSTNLQKLWLPGIRRAQGRWEVGWQGKAITVPLCTTFADSPSPIQAPLSECGLTHHVKHFVPQLNGMRNVHLCMGIVRGDWPWDIPFSMQLGCGSYLPFAMLFVTPVLLGKLGEIEQSMTVLAKLRNARSAFCQHFSLIVSCFGLG